MNTKSIDSLLEEIDRRNRKVRRLEAEIEQIYVASRFLIEHAKETCNEGGREALRNWDKVRPNAYKGEKL